MASERLQKSKVAVVLLVLQLAYIILFAVTTDYEDSAKPPASLMIVAHGNNDNNNNDSEAVGSDGQGDGHSHDHDPAPGVSSGPGPVISYLPLFQDVHVMVFVGIGFLITFLKKYGYSGVGFNMMIGAVTLQWGILMSGYVHAGGSEVKVGIVSMLTAEFAAATALISMGAFLGKTSPLQLIVIGILETVIFAVNEWIGLSVLKVVDVGGSMFVHAFAAYFGLAVARVLYKDDVAQSEKEATNKSSDMTSMIGTLFLWLFWPSFNAALAVEDGQERALINSYVALAACCVVVCAMSILTSPHGKLDMVHVQNATLAGGVAVGTTADMMIGIHAALIIGSIAGAISVIGFRYITPFMTTKLKIHDTCGIHNLHGMPAVLAAIAGCIATLVADESKYGYTLYRQFPARAPADASSPEFQRIAQHLDISTGKGRSASEQAGYQIAALGITVVVAIVGGVLVGLVVRFLPLNQPGGEMLFEDEDNWDVPQEPRMSELSAALLKTDGKPELETAFSKDQ